MAVIYFIMLIEELNWIGAFVPIVIIISGLLQKVLNNRVLKPLFIEKSLISEKIATKVTQVISGAKATKFNAWEGIIYDQMAEMKLKDKKLVAKSFILKGVVSSILNSIPAVTSIVCLSLYQRYIRELDVGKSYSILLIMNQLITPLSGFLIIFTQLVQARVSAKRLMSLFKIGDSEEILDSPELEKGSVIVRNGSFTWKDDFYKKLFKDDENEKNNKGKKNVGEKQPLMSLESSCSFYKDFVSIESNKNSIRRESQKSLRKSSKKSLGEHSIEDYENFPEFEEENEEIKEEVLTNINLKITPKSFTVIIGKVGCGKSSLVKSLMKQTKLKMGSVSKNGTFAFIAQGAFIINDTLQNNILFGKKYNKERYEKVIEICQLLPDIEILQGGDQTEIGENGINLSGGQKQRISIARAVYADRDIYVIDDCLSALDAYVGKNILEKVFKEFLKDKTRIMVTHYLHFLHEMDKVVLLDQGRIVAQGDFEFVKKTQSYKEFSVVAEQIIEEERMMQEEEEEEKKKEELKLIKNQKNQKIEEKLRKDSDSSLGFLDEISSKPSSGKSKIINIQNPEKKELLKEKGTLIKQETRFTGMVERAVYSYYFSKGGICALLIFIFLAIVTVIMGLFGNWWIGQWSFNALDKAPSFYAWVYLGLVFLYVIFFILKSTSYAVFSSRIG